MQQIRPIRRPRPARPASPPAPAPRGLHPDVVVDYHVGPASGRGPRACLECRNLFARGDRWVELRPLDGSYTVGVHTACLHANDRRALAAEDEEASDVKAA